MSGQFVLPPMTKPINEVRIDMTPDRNLPLRILWAYRDECDCLWSDNTNGSEPMNPLLIAMNEDQRQRALILDRAIARLSR